MRPSIKLSLLCGALLCASIFPSAAWADIAGDTLNFSYDFPNYGTFAANDGNFVANGVVHNFEGYFNYTANSNQIVFAFPPNSGLLGPSDGDPFSGPIITDLTQSLAGYTVALDPSSTAGYGFFSAFISGNQFAVNLGDISVGTAGATLIFDLTAPTPILPPPPPPPVSAATPEPSSLALLGTGLVSVVGMVRRRVKA